jgi:hypothetical protein
MGAIDGKPFIICTLYFSAASYTRVKSEVQVLYRPPLLYLGAGIFLITFPGF